MQEEEALERARAEEEARGRTSGTKLSCRGLYFGMEQDCAEDMGGKTQVSKYRPT